MFEDGITQAFVDQVKSTASFMVQYKRLRDSSEWSTMSERARDDAICLIEDDGSVSVRFWDLPENRVRTEWYLDGKVIYRTSRRCDLFYAINPCSSMLNRVIQSLAA